MIESSEFIKNGSPKGFKAEYEYRVQLVWRNVLILGYLHTAALYGFVLTFGGYTKWQTVLWILFLGISSTLGVTGGGHRLWAHKCYKANLPLRIFLATLMTMTFQNHIYEWARDHRVHHKFAETDGDPHNAKRGFFFSHVGWLLVKKHRDVIRKGKTVDMSDLEQDGVVMFQKKYYGPLVLMCTFILPTLAAHYFWDENLWTAWYTATVFRYVLSVNLVWCINSAAHIFGTKPYNKNIGATQNPLMMLIALGEGFHNYHHTFPWDYKAAEFSGDVRNMTTFMIEFFARIGWATELKTASEKMIRSRILRTGDGTCKPDVDAMRRDFVEDIYEDRCDGLWGWGDDNMTKDDIKQIKIDNNIEDLK